MRKRYTLPAVTADGQDTSIGIEVDDVAKLREWLNDVKRLVAVDGFRFRWSKNPRSTAPILRGSFYTLWYPDGIYVKLKLYYEDYRNMEYPLSDFCKMLFKSERPSLGWCITVTVR